MKYGSLFLRFFFAILVGLYGTSIYLQNSFRFKSIVLEGLETLYKTQLQSKFLGSVSSVSFFPPSLEIKDVSVEPCSGGKEWMWSAKKMKLIGSLIEIFKYKKIGLSVQLEDMKIESLVHNRIPAIVHMLRPLIETGPETLPCIFKNLSLVRANIHIYEQLGGLESSISFNGQLSKIGPHIKTSFYFLDGCLSYGTLPLWTNLSGIVHFEHNAKQSSLLQSYASIDCSIRFPFLSEGAKECSIEGQWKVGRGSLVLYNTDRTFLLDSVDAIGTKSGLFLNGIMSFPFSVLSYFSPYLSSSDVDGKVVVSFIQTSSNGFSGCVEGIKLSYKGVEIGSCKVPFILLGDLWRGSFHGVKNEDRLLGIWEFDEGEKTGNVSLTNSSPWHFLKDSYWCVNPYLGKVWASFNGNGLVEGGYDVTLEHEKTETIFHNNGSIFVSHSGQCEARGTIGNREFIGRLSLFSETLSPFFSLKQDEQEEIHIQESYKGIRASVSFDSVRSMVRDLYGISLSGKGIFEFEGALKKDELEGVVVLKNGTIRIPTMYNFISQFSTHINVSWFPFVVQCKNIFLELHKGTLSVPEFHCEFDREYVPKKVFMPFSVEHCFVNWHNHLFAVISAQGKLTKNEGEPYKLEGALEIEKSQLKENPFSVQEQRNIARFILPVSLFGKAGLLINLSIETKNPTFIKTPQLEARSTVSLKLLHSLELPELSGTIKLSDGKIFFPYKSLHISRAVMHFLPDQPYNPLLDIVAQETIRKYQVKLYISGSLQNPLISFQSNPHLTEEQIATLLFTGSIEESLNLVVPTFIMHNVETLIFGAAHKRTHFSSLFETLKRMRIVPHFSDESGRGGVRWAIEIEVSDHLHAIIEKNFTLSEDTRFEVDYLFSDDVSFKFTRDQRNDLGAEVEMKFSF